MPGRRQSGDLPHQHVLVVGLGRFGVSVATSLQSLGHEVLAVDHDGEIIREYAADFTALVQADATSEDAMREIGVHEYQRAVVGVGPVEDSTLCVTILADLGVQEIWAKAQSDRHGRILERVGAAHVVFPEKDAGSRVAHLVSGSLLDFIEFEGGFAIIKVRPPRSVIGRTLAEAALRTKYGVTVVGLKSPGRDFVYARPETVVSRDDLMVVAGETRLLERLAASGALEREGEA